MQDTSEKDIWEDDLLGYEDAAQTFTRLIKTIDDTKVISIEAGYGRGKTFFRERWAEHMRAEGEVVVEADAHLSDHSGDPVVTFIGAMLAAVPKADKEVRKKTLERGKKIAGMAGKAALGYVAKSMANEIVEGLTETAADQVEGIETLEQAIDDMGKGLSKLAGKLIEGQLAAEQVRQKELPEQLSALRDALTKDAGTNRVVILIDELDRCHPDYAIAFLEAMKLVFAHEGFVFCLMVNAEYLEALATRRFGEMTAGERYLDKFIDMRLALPKVTEVISGATEELFLCLPDGTPFGFREEFTIAAAAKLAGQIASLSQLTIRQIKRIKLKVELTIRCYSEQPMDYSLLVYLAFRDAIQENEQKFTVEMSRLLPRIQLTPQYGQSLDHSVQNDISDTSARKADRAHKANFPELAKLPEDRYRLPEGQHSAEWAKVGIFLAKHYIPDHESALNALRQFEVTGADKSNE